MKDLLPFNNAITIKDHLYSKTLKLIKAIKKTLGYRRSFLNLIVTKDQLAYKNL